MIFKKGRIVPLSQRKAVAIANKKRTGNLHPRWLGNKVCYTHLHSWLRRHIPIPKRCPKCRKRKKLDMANLTGIYDRDNPKNWGYLCRRCHMKFDNQWAKSWKTKKKKGGK